MGSLWHTVRLDKIAAIMEFSRDVSFPLISYLKKYT